MSSPIANTLERLSLTAHVTMFVPLVVANQNAPFQSLTYLFLSLIDLKFLNPFSEAAKSLSTSRVVAPFLLSLAPTLRCLSIKAEVTLGPLFNALTHSNSSVSFPNLKSLLLTFIPSITAQTDPQFLRDFLLSHNENLQRLYVKFETFRMRQTTSIGDGSEEWFTDLANSNYPFPTLKALEIYTQARLSYVLPILRRTASTLSSLTLCDRYLTDEEGEQVLDVLTVQDGQATKKEEPIPLKRLCIDIFQLNVPFLDLLAFKLPQLEELTLGVYKPVQDPGPFLEVLRRRPYDSSTSTRDVLHSWKLRELTIREVGKAESVAEREVARAIPALARGMIS